MKHKTNVTQSQLKELFDYNPHTGNFIRKTSGKGTGNKKGAIAGYTRPDNYIVINVLSIQYRAHRLAWLYVTGEWPKDLIDHINGSPSDNRWCNLREATNSENCINSNIRNDNSSGQKGVTWCKTKNKWKARISINGVVTSLGYHSNIEDAAEKYNNAALKHHGEFSRL